MKRIFGTGFFIAALFLYAAPAAHATQLNFVSDTITDSRPATTTDHMIVFGVPSGVPASGKITVAFENTAFAIDPSFSYQDADLAVSAVSPFSGFVNRDLAATADATNDGVAVTPTTGPITFTLNSTSGITPGSYVKISLGTNASFGGAGTYQIVNPTSTGSVSYRLQLNTADASNAALDYDSAMVVILPAVGVDLNQNRVNPAVLSNGLPSGTIPSNISGVLLSLNTDVFSECRYATSSGVAYNSMTNDFVATSLGTFHTATTYGTFVKGTTYNYYVRCVDFAGNKNLSDYIISFTAGDPTGTGVGGGTGGGTPAAPGSSGGGVGGGAPFPPGPAQPSLILRGIAFPGATLSVLQDGKALSVSTIADTSGNFSVSIPSLPQGTYSFTLLVKDSSGKSVSSYTTTITIISGTTNSVTGIVMPPTVTLAKSTVSPGAPVAIGGFAEPLAGIELHVTSQSNLKSPVTATTTAGANGIWSYSLVTTGYPVDTYQIKARALVTGLSASDYSDIAYLGVGQAPVPKAGIADLNGDGKVNLVDFSILLFHWGTNFPAADLNKDGTVNLIDFSILLFHWTG